MTAEREALSAEIAGVLRENMSRGTSGRYIVSYGITPEDFAGALADLLAARDRRVRAEAVWHVSAFGRGRSVDRVCDSLATGQSVCDDLMEQLGGEWSVVEDWANLNVPGAPERWVRYVSRDGGEPVEQIVAAMQVDTSGTWFRERDEDDA